MSDTVQLAWTADEDAPSALRVAQSGDRPTIAVEAAFLGTLPDHPRETIEHGPLEYRLAQYPDGRLVLQGRYRLEDTSHGGLFVYSHRYEWRDLPTVVVAHQEEPA